MQPVDRSFASGMLWLLAALCWLVISALFYYWFAIADRYVIFLYGHLRATPFDAGTSSRYWMAGLVAAGIVTMGYGVWNWYAGRIAALRYRMYHPPPWRQLWLLCALPLTFSIPGIVMNVNQPTLPLPLALAAVASTLIGLAIGLPLASLAAQHFLRLFWLLITALGLVPSLLLLRVVELSVPGRIDHGTAITIAIGSTLLGALWVMLMSRVSLRWGNPPRSAFDLFRAGLWISYLLLPVVHYLFFTPPAYRYISVADNFFARTLWTQLACLATAFLLAVGATRILWRAPISTAP